jgi:hypothetical protein
MTKIDSFIIKENNIFYFDSDSYNQVNEDIKMENGDIIKFNYENQKYMGKLVELSSKNGLMLINTLK